MKVFPGYITEALLSQGQTKGQGFTRNSLRVMLNSWMTPGDEATFIVGENDLCIPETIRNQTVSTQTIIWVLPGHLGVPKGMELWDVKEAARIIARQNFNDCTDALRLIRELGERPAQSVPDVEEVVKRVLEEMQR